MATTAAVQAPVDRRARSLDLGAFFSALRRRWKVMVAVALLVAATVIGTAFVLPPVWSATTLIQIEPNRQSPTDFKETIQGGAPDQAIVDTEVARMRSRDVLRRVVAEFRLDRDAEFVGGSASVSDKLAVEKAISALQRKLSVARQGTAYVVAITAASRDRDKAPLLANSVAKHYLQASVDVRAQDASMQSTQLSDQLNNLGQEVQQAEARVAAYRSRENIVQTGQAGTVTDQQIAPLTEQLSKAEADAATAQARLASARAQIAKGGIEDVSSVLNSPVIGELRKQRAEILEREGEVSRYLEKHPARIALDKQLADIDRQIAEESQRIVAGLDSEARSATAIAARLRGDLSGLRAQQASNNQASVTAESLERQAEARRTVYNQLAEAAQRTNQQGQGARSLGTVVDPADPPLSPSFPNRPLFVVLGIFVGIMAGAAVVALLEMADASIRSVSDLEDGLGIAHLSSVPLVSTTRLAKSGHQLSDYVVDRPMSVFAESLRNIRSALVVGEDVRVQVVAVCSAVPGEGKSVISLGLAKTMAMSGDSAVIVDCDLRLGKLAEMTSIVVEKGLTDLLEGRATLDEVLHVDERTGLAILPFARRDFSSRDFFGGEPMGQLLGQLRQRFQFVVLDTPPVLAVAEARTIAALADGVILVTRANRTSRFAVRAALSRLRKAKARLVGAVLSGVRKGAKNLDPSDPGYYLRSYEGYSES